MSDLIKRKDAILMIQRHGVGCFDADEYYPEEAERFVISMLEKLPSAEPEREIGEWVGIREYCNYLRSLDSKMYVPSGIGITMKYCNLCWESAERATNYCPNCGAFMGGEEE